MNYEVNINIKLETDHKVIVEASCKEEAVDIAEHNYDEGFYNEEIVEAISNEEWETVIEEDRTLQKLKKEEGYRNGKLAKWSIV